MNIFYKDNHDSNDGLIKAILLFSLSLHPKPCDEFFFTVYLSNLLDSCAESVICLSLSLLCTHTHYRCRCFLFIKC